MCRPQTRQLPSCLELPGALHRTLLFRINSCMSPPMRTSKASCTFVDTRKRPVGFQKSPRLHIPFNLFRNKEVEYAHNIVSAPLKKKHHRVCVVQISEISNIAGARNASHLLMDPPEGPGLPASLVDRQTKAFRTRWTWSQVISSRKSARSTPPLRALKLRWWTKRHPRRTAVEPFAIHATLATRVALSRAPEHMFMAHLSVRVLALDHPATNRVHPGPWLPPPPSALQNHCVCLSQQQSNNSPPRPSRGAESMRRVRSQTSTLILRNARFLSTVPRQTMSSMPRMRRPAH